MSLSLELEVENFDFKGAHSSFVSSMRWLRNFIRDILFTAVTILEIKSLKVDTRAVWNAWQPVFLFKTRPAEWAAPKYFKITAVYIMSTFYAERPA